MNIAYNKSINFSQYQLSFNSFNWVTSDLRVYNQNGCQDHPLLRLSYALLTLSLQFTFKLGYAHYIVYCGTYHIIAITDSKLFHSGFWR